MSDSLTGSSQTPAVLLLAFNRPHLAVTTFNRIRAAQPRQLYFAVDGARPNRPAEAENVSAVKRLATQVDWDCEVRTLFRDSNLGCKRAVSEAITWFFENVERGIVLEDDCVPAPAFFPFMAELLDRFENDPRIMMISGDNFQFGRQVTLQSYYFSRYTHIWGWATWRRAWRLYDHKMVAWPALKRSGWLEDSLQDKRAVAYWTSIFDETFGDLNDAWDYRWTFAAWLNNALTVLPAVNLVSNIGFGEAGTNNWRRSSPVASLSTGTLQFPLDHPTVIAREILADDFTQKTLFTRPRWRKLARALYKKFLRRHRRD